MKTTALGILTIVIAVANIAVQVIKTGNANFGELIPAITAGWALLHAQDSTPSDGK